MTGFNEKTSTIRWKPRTVSDEDGASQKEESTAYAHLFPVPARSFGARDDTNTVVDDATLRQRLLAQLFAVPAKNETAGRDEDDDDVVVTSTTIAITTTSSGSTGTYHRVTTTTTRRRNSQHAGDGGGATAIDGLCRALHGGTPKGGRAHGGQDAGQAEEGNEQETQKSRYDDDDDYLWDDSDDEDDDTKTSLCLLTGPVGCGKSQLVHTVARRIGCRKVLELHTGVKRGAAAMKRCIEEATKSHSTLDMLHNKKQRNDAAAAFFQKRQELVDSESENDDDDDENNEGAKGTSVSVILLDEADNLYEEQGDNGFWTALSDLYKRSKCPIILTANTVPKNLTSKGFRFAHIEVGTPTPAECARKLYEAARAEGLTLCASETDAMKGLEQIATLGNCDLRRLLHELQVFSLTESSSSVVVRCCCSCRHGNGRFWRRNQCKQQPISYNYYSTASLCRVCQTQRGPFG